MANKVIHKHSVVKDSVPSGTTLEYGEIAVNYNENNPFIAIRTSGTSTTDYAKFLSSDKLVLKENYQSDKDELDADIASLTTQLGTKSSSTHTHGKITLSGGATGSASIGSGTSAINIAVTVTDDSHTHDGRYYTETEVNNLLTSKSDTAHTHSQYLTSVPSHASTSTTYGSATLSNYGHVKLATGDVSTATAATNGVAASTYHNHDGDYYTQTQVNNLLTSKSDSSHTHSQYLTSSNIKNLTFSAGTFSAKTFDPDSADTTVNIPSKTSHLSNDSGFITSAATVKVAASATNATTASKLGSSNVGSATNPIYLSSGTPKACTYTLNKSVPSDAVFTDTNTWRPIYDGVDSTSTTTGASANAVKTAYDKAVSAYNLANSKTSNNGTVTSVTVKGASGLTGSGTVSTSGTITLGHSTSVSSSTAATTLSHSGTFKVPTVGLDSYGHVTSTTTTTYTLPADSNTHHTAYLRTASATSSTSNTTDTGNGVYFNLVENGSVRSNTLVCGATNVTVTSPTAGTIVITGPSLSGYSPTSHTHSIYSLTSHTHSNYSLTSHTHSAYASSSHTHSYAPIAHATSATTYGVATTANYGHVKISNGDCNSVASADGLVAGMDHTHGNYAAASHSHSNYLTAETYKGTLTGCVITSASTLTTASPVYVSNGYSYCNFLNYNGTVADSFRIIGIGGVKTFASAGTLVVSGASDYRVGSYAPSSMSSSSTYYFLAHSGSSAYTGATYRTGLYASGTSAATTLHGCTGYYQDSDETLKTFHGEIPIDIEKLRKLPKSYFTWNADEDGVMQIGTSAQKVRELYPEIVSEEPDTGKLSVDYSKLSIIALKAFDKVCDELDQLKADMALIKEKLNI